MTTASFLNYGLGGELLAEYAANADHLSPQKEYGYRNGQLLVTATVTSGWGTAPTLNDNPLVVNETMVQARHITELRDAINALRSHLNMSPYPWQYSVTTNDWVTANPILEMRTALDQALGAPSGGYSAGLAQYEPVKAIHIQELRDRVLAAWTTGSSTQISWLVTDQLGTPRIIFDQGGSLANTSRHDYLPFGEELSVGLRNTIPSYTNNDGARQKFTQKERDAETGLDWFGPGRYYSNTQGRFTSVDPSGAGANVTNPQSLNRYTYTLNRPTIAIDPDGLSTIVVTVTTHDNDNPTAVLQLMASNGDFVGDPVDGLAAGTAGRNRTIRSGDTPYGVYTANALPTEGGDMDSRLGVGFGTGKIRFDQVSSELIGTDRDNEIRIHGGGTGLPAPYRLDQKLLPTTGCVRVWNQDVNNLITFIRRLAANGDPLNRVFIGDQTYLTNLANQTNANHNYLYPDLRLSLGMYHNDAERNQLVQADRQRRQAEQQAREERERQRRQQRRNRRPENQ